LPTTSTDAAVSSLASGLPYNYTVGSGLDLNYGADKGFLIAGGVASYGQSYDLPGITVASNGSGGNLGTLNGVVSTQWYDIIPAFIGGSCKGTAPTCAGGTYTLCNENECRNASTASGASNSTDPNTVWDTPTSSCVKDADECTNKFGANSSRYCRETQGVCIDPLTNVPSTTNLAKDQCPNYKDCKAAGGYWDYWTLRNKCRETRSACASGGANNLKENAAGTGTVPAGNSNASGDPNLCDKN